MVVTVPRFQEKIYTILNLNCNLILSWWSCACHKPQLHLFFLIKKNQISPFKGFHMFSNRSASHYLDEAFAKSWLFLACLIKETQYCIACLICREHSCSFCLSDSYGITSFKYRRTDIAARPDKVYPEHKRVRASPQRAYQQCLSKWRTSAFPE